MAANHGNRNWDSAEDIVLASIVIEEVSKGNTFNKAYEIASEKITKQSGIERTLDSVSFRWNSILKKNHKKAIEQAKQQGRIAKSSRVHNKSTELTQPDEIEEFISQTKTNDAKLLFESSTPIIKPERTNKPINAVDQAFENLENLTSFIESVGSLTITVNALTSENESLVSENNKIKSNYDKLEQKFKDLSEDYAAVLKVINTARKLSITQEEPQEKFQANKFRMEGNGNLTRV